MGLRKGSRKVKESTVSEPILEPKPCEKYSKSRVQGRWKSPRSVNPSLNPSLVKKYSKARVQERVQGRWKSLRSVNPSLNPSLVKNTLRQGFKDGGRVHGQ
ncbi:hypothetical protein KY285_019067 [Solanum tuberosum]|nr:hypothetical protein KY284_016494 [Solanum tuberosum]KAH0704789.1 hypothetical protein KY285_019067 [Solanum tuberosum]